MNEAKINVVLVMPEIPQNTGNISRTCVLTDSTLHLVGPLGFSIEDRHLKRAGLDYWKYLNLKFYESWDKFIQVNLNANLILFSTRGTNKYINYSFTDSDFLVFGSETSGLPDKCFQSLNNPGNILRIPMKKTIRRSLNLSNSVAIVVFEAMRQLGFPGMD